MRVLSGIQPTGRFHWGNYFGAIRQYIDLQTHDQAFYFIADLHALTTVRNPEELRSLSRDAAIDLLSLGLDPEQACLFLQSDVPEVCELTWLLMTVTQMSLLEKCHAYKDKKEKGLPADAGLFTYPVLMAADILLYDSQLVPVGADQKQHIEVTRDIAQRFNTIYACEALTLPEPYIVESTAKVPGIDGEKMSKSYDNTIPVFDTPKRIRKRIMQIKTDSTPVEAPKDPDRCAVFTLYRLFSTPEQQTALAERYRAGGMGYGEAKEALAQQALQFFDESFQRRARWEQDSDGVTDVLRRGAARARSKGAEVLDRVRAACGLSRRR